MSTNHIRRHLALLPLPLCCLALAGAPGSAAAQPSFDVLHTFDSPPRQPSGNLIKGPDGALYGTAFIGGAWNIGVIFRIDDDGSNFAKLLDFDGTNGANPYAGLVVGSDGALYGTTPYGGAFGQGVAFRITLDGSSFTKLRDFDNASGGFPFASLVVGSDGALYGTTTGGGASGYGGVFRITEDGSSYTTLHDFSFADGASPQAGLVIGSDGALYGTTASGGVSGQGVVFRITEDGASVPSRKSVKRPGSCDGSAWR